MANWNEIMSGAKKTFHKAAMKVGEVADCAAESMKIEALKIKLAEKYEELGRIVYEEVKSSKTNAARVGEKAAEIDALIAQIEELKAKKKNKKSGEVKAEEK
jgi:hypothetical protein